MPANRGLGKGLGALIQDNAYIMPESEDGAQVKENVLLLDMNDIRPNAEQPRKEFETEKLEQLAESIKAHGVLQPILVKKDGDFYMIIAGERRYRAALKAGLKEIPSIVRDMNDSELLQTALIENIQREDLNEMETAAAYRELIDRFGMTQDAVAAGVGKSRAAVANTLRLLNLPENVKKMVKSGKLSAGQARTVLSLDNEKERSDFAELIAKKAMTVREAEKAVKTFAADSRPKAKKAPTTANEPAKGYIKPPYLMSLEEELSECVGSRVSINSRGNSGTVEIEYYGNDDLDRIIDILKGTPERL